MPDVVITALVNAGVLGPVLVTLGYLYARLQKRLEDVHEKRTADAQAVVERILEIADRQNETAQSLSAAIQAHTHAITELREILRARR